VSAKDHGSGLPSSIAFWKIKPGGELCFSVCQLLLVVILDVLHIYSDAHGIVEAAPIRFWPMLKLGKAFPKVLIHPKPTFFHC
jgi:hypothetical protein